MVARQRVVFEGADRVRLDQFVARIVSDRVRALSRAQAQRLIDAGDVTVNGAAARPGYRLRPGDAVEVVVRPPVEARAVPQDIPLTVLYEDEHLIAIDKPAGLVVHPAPGHPDGTLVNALLAHCRDLSGIGGALRPGIVHRLDKDTSGVMVATKTDAAHRALVDRFASGKGSAIEREYIAVVAPPPRAREGVFDTLHGRHPNDRKKFSSKVARGKRAVTHWRVVQDLAGAAVVRCTLATGRTHQIRVHFADAGSPVVGDAVYGRRRRPFADRIDRQALHAAVLAFAHPITGEPLRFESPLPDDMRRLIAALAG
ncbi:MAG: RluA family pseudouridine synthase [Deltaproteobacteria bacterium]|nr:MAG: RluA family pseudouridine synthase [Deltaproteobacteria bacterium]